jgi:tol-pal system protein YbgF
MYKHLLATVLIAVVSSSQAQVRVVESSPQSTRSGVGQPSLNAGLQADTLSDIQALKYEVANLRGMIEEQAHEIARLKQQQTENYLDLDKRVSDLSTGGISVRPPTSAPAARTLPAPTQAIAPAVVTPTQSGGGDTEVYTAAYDLLRQKQFDAAIAGFNDYLARFPRGAYAGNSYYWLGEIYLLKEDFAQARDWFGKLLTEFPQDRKIPDAQFKLGKVYHLMGDNAQARTLLDQTAAGSGDAARLARQYLQDNF